MVLTAFQYSNQFPFCVFRYFVQNALKNVKKSKGIMHKTDMTVLWEFNKNV